MDIVFIVLMAYLLLTFGIAWYFSRRESIEAYFLNSKSTGLWMMAFSTVATVVGAGATVAVVSEVYNTGISYGLFLPVSFVAGMIILGILSYKIREFGGRFKAYTIVDFFDKRFDKKNKVIVTILQLLLLIIWIGLQAVAFASLASVLIGIDYEIALVIAAFVTLIYTSMGGLKIDIITDFFQFWIFTILFIIMSLVGYNSIGGFASLFSRLPPGHLDPFAFGGVGFFVFGILMSGFLYLGNTSHWQRIYSAKSPAIVRKAFFLTIPIIIVIGFMIIFFGLLAAASITGITKEQALFVLMKNMLPAWMVGIGFAAILAVIMSSVDSIIIGGSTIIHKNLLLKRFNNIRYARLTTFAFGLLGFVVAFIFPDIVALSLFVSYLALIFVPPIFAGLYSKKTSSDACFYALLIPSIILAFAYPFLGANTFMVTTPIGIIIIIFYDIIFKRKKKIV